MKKLILTGSVLAALSAVQAQEDLSKRFPNAEAVYTNVRCDVNITKENGKWIATSSVTEDLQFLSDNSVKMMGKGRIYHSSFTQLKKWDAYTQVSERKKIKVANVSTASSRQDYIFYDDVQATSFDFAGAGVGTTRHLEYQVQYNDIQMLSPHYFERYFPVLEGEIRITFPSDIKLKYLIKGLSKEKVRMEQSQKRDRTTYTFHISDLAGVQPYPDAPDNSYYATHLIYYVEQVKEGDNWKNFLSSPDDLYASNYEHIRNLNKTLSPELKVLTDSITHGAGTAGEKARKIYKWVQTQIKYVAFESGMEGFVPREANLVCTRRFGDCKDMTSILTAMLNYSGVPAYFTWIGTRDIPYDYSEVPLPIVDNHMICAIRLGDNYIFLDGTDDGCIFGMPPSGIQGKQAMVGIGEKEYKLIRVPVTPKEQNRYSDSTFLELTENGITGRIKLHLTGYYSSGMYSVLSSTNKEEMEDYFKNRFARASNKIRLFNWKIDLKPDHTEAVITADLELPGYAKKMGDEWFVNLNLFKWYENHEIDYPKRTMPVSFEYLKHSYYFTSLKMPAGFKVSYLPVNETYKNDVWGFVMKYATTNNEVTLTQEFEDNQLMLQPSQFESWNKVLEHLFPHYKQTVVLSKN
jgi:hypothetical protein